MMRSIYNPSPSSIDLYIDDKRAKVGCDLSIVWWAKERLCSIHPSRFSSSCKTRIYTPDERQYQVSVFTANRSCKSLVSVFTAQVPLAN
jgi:hypothetical protein